MQRHQLQFPRETEHLGQDEAYFYLFEGDSKRKIRFHDYDVIYQVAGLYEQLFYERLKCNSPQKVCEILKETIEQSLCNFSELRVLDFGAGNGIVGEFLKTFGISRLVGVDILPEAKLAVERDRPGIYDDYYVADFINILEEDLEEIQSWSFDCLITVAALGFGDIPPAAFVQAFNILQPEAWVAFNIKESFLDNSDASGFSRMIRDLIFSEYLDLYHLERYRHRFSIAGKPLYYFAVSGKKNENIPLDFMKGYEKQLTTAIFPSNQHKKSNLKGSIIEFPISNIR